MSVRVAAVDPYPMFTRGVAATLGDDGHVVETPDDLLEWARRDGPPVVLLTLLGPPDWGLLGDLLRSCPDAAVVAFVEEPDLVTYSRALATGARGVLPRNAAPGTILATFHAAVHDSVLLPAYVVRALVTAGAIGPTAAVMPDGREIGWLRRLRQGATVAQLAVDSGYSERMMFRLLAGVYAKLHASNRTEAIVYAHEQGWI